MSTLTTFTRTAVATLAVLSLSSGIAVANPCDTDASFAAANDCATPAAQVLSASVDAPSAAPTMVAGLGLLVR